MRRLTTAAVAFAASTSIASAGGIDRSGQFLGPLFQTGGESGSYVELSFGSVNPNGVDTGAFSLPDMLPAYTQAGFAYKTNLSDSLSAALIVDQPFGAAVTYPAGLPFLGANATVNSRAATGILRYKMDGGVSVHGGVRALSVTGSITSPPDQLDASSNWNFGYVVGAAYERPDIALRVALTYNSAITAKMTGTENGGAVAFNVRMPESINLEFQTGVAADTLLMGSVRHVRWDGFNLTTPLKNYVAFTENTTTYSLGLGRRITDNFSASAMLGYEAPGARPGTTPLAPTTGLTSLTLAGSYTMDTMTVSGGVTVGRPGGQTFGPLVTSGNTVVGAGIRVGFSF